MTRECDMMKAEKMDRMLTVVVFWI